MIFPLFIGVPVSWSFRGILVPLLRVLPFCTSGEERVSKAPRREAPQTGLGRQMRGGRGRAQRASRGPRGGRGGRAPQRVLVSSSGTSIFEIYTGVGCVLVASDYSITLKRSGFPKRDHYFWLCQRNLRLALLNGFLARPAASKSFSLLLPFTPPQHYWPQCLCILPILPLMVGSI